MGDIWNTRMPMKTTKTVTSRRSAGRSAYTVAEDENILRYILTDDRYSEVKGNSMWVKMANKNVVGGRTWQSLRNRYLKSILPNLHKYGFISSRDKERLTSGKRFTKQSEFADESSDEDSKKSCASKKYSLHTDEVILKFLVSRKKFDGLSGNEIWKEMAHLKITQHSWQSMRNRFRKHIAKNLHVYNIGDYAKKQIKSGISNQLAVDSSSDDTDQDIQDSSDNNDAELASRISDSSQERMKKILKKNSSHSDNVDIESNSVNCDTALKVKEPARVEMPQQDANISRKSDDTSEEDCDMARPTLTRRLKGQKKKVLENSVVATPEPSTSTVGLEMPLQDGNNIARQSDDTSEEDCDMARPTLAGRFKEQKKKAIENSVIATPEPSTSTVGLEMPLQDGNNIARQSDDDTSEEDCDMARPTLAGRLKRKKSKVPENSVVDAPEPSTSTVGLEKPQQDKNNIARLSDDDASDEDCDMARPTLAGKLKEQKKKAIENSVIATPEPTTSTVDANMAKSTEHDEHIDTSSVEFSSTSEEEIDIPTTCENDELSQCAPIVVNANETLARDVFAFQAIQNENSNSSTDGLDITTNGNCASYLSCESPLDEAVVQIDCQNVTEDKDSVGSCESISKMQLEIGSASDIETNSECSETVDDCEMNEPAQAELDVANPVTHCESLPETKSDETENDAISARLCELADVQKTLYDIENVSEQKFINMIQCNADIIGVSSEALMQLL